MGEGNRYLFKVMENIDFSRIAKFFLIIVSFVFFYFFYNALITSPWEGDSLAYHIPIAKSYLDGSILIPAEEKYLLFYPGAGEGILALLMILNLPLNLFNLIGVIFLFLLSYILGKSFALSKNISMIFAANITLLPSVIRLIPTQTIDIWLANFFIASLILFKNLKHSKKYFFLLGISLGMLVGIKYSGLLFFFVLIALYLPKLVKNINFFNFLLFIFPIILLGFSWYVRNWFLTGNPFYPGNFFFFSGNENFKLLEWQLWKTFAYYPNGIYKGVSAFISEYLVWTLALSAPVVFPWLVYIKKQPHKDLLVLLSLGVINFVVCLSLPSWPENIVSDLRYTYPAFIPLILSFFILNEKRKISFFPVLITLNPIFVLPQLGYHPKLFFSYFIFLSTVIIMQKKFRKV